MKIIRYFFLVLIICFTQTLFAQGKGKEQKQKVPSAKLELIKDQYILELSAEQFRPFSSTEKAKTFKHTNEKAKAYNAYNISLQKRVESHLTKNGIREFKILNFSSGASTVMTLKCNAKTITQIVGQLKPGTFLPDMLVSNPESEKPTAEIKEGIVIYPTQQYKEPTNIDVLRKIKAENTNGNGKTAIIISHKIVPHSDLNLNESLSLDLVNIYPNDRTNGQAYAGMIGALDNNIGLKGIAANAEIVSIAAIKNNKTYSWGDFLTALGYASGISTSGDCIVIDHVYNLTNIIESTYTSDDPIEAIIDHLSASYEEMNEETPDIFEMYYTTRSMVRNIIKSMADVGKFIAISASNEFLLTGMTYGGYNNKIKNTFLGNISRDNVHYVAGCHTQATSALNFSHAYYLQGNQIKYVANSEQWPVMSVPSNGSPSGYYTNFENVHYAVAIVAGILLANDGVVYPNGTVQTMVDSPTGQQVPIVYIVASAMP